MSAHQLGRARTRCPDHWRGKHKWVGPDDMSMPLWMTRGCYALLHCARCGTTFASAAALSRED